MVKADAYGLGARRVVDTLEPLGPWGFGVATVEEGAQLRSWGVRRPVLVLSPLPPGSYRRAVEEGLSVVVGELGALERLAEAARAVGRPGRFHLEVDTGMGRAGLPWDAAEEWWGAVQGVLGPHLVWEGCFTHFHSADLRDASATLEQCRRFAEAVGKWGGPWPEGVLLHASNSAGALRWRDLIRWAPFPIPPMALVRPGIHLYGGLAGEGLPAPEPVAALRARITLVRQVAQGATVGYGATYRAPGPRRWATVGIGYGDGLPRLLSHRGGALVRGVRVPMVGRISMDVTVLDVSGVGGVEPGEVATFFGRDGPGEISLEEVAGWAETISYEILTGLGPRVPRVWVEEEGPGERGRGALGGRRFGEGGENPGNASWV